MALVSRARLTEMAGVVRTKIIFIIVDRIAARDKQVSS